MVLTNNVHMTINDERDSLTGYFLPDQYKIRNMLAREKLDSIAKTVLGTDEIEKDTVVYWNDTPENYVKTKESFFITVYFRYSRIFELCRVLGVSNIYDIGCQTINQSFLLARYSTVSYTGITTGRFELNDYRLADYDTLNACNFVTRQAPPPFCNGRIKFVLGYYPDVPLEIKPNNIAIACYALYQNDEDSIKNISSAFVRDFDRVLFDIDFHRKEICSIWKNQDWGEFQFFPIGPRGFVFGTKNPEDIRRLKETYPFEDGKFITGIDDSVNYAHCRIPDNIFEQYAEWN